MTKAFYALSQPLNRFFLLSCFGFLMTYPHASALAVGADSIQKSISLTADSHTSSRYSQKKIDSFSDATQEMVDSILQNNRQSNITEAYNAQLSKLIDSQLGEVDSLQAQIDSIEETEQAMLPLLNVMVSQISDFVESDVPFLLDERQKRVTKLISLLDRADVSVAEKYRQILEAYLIEVGYGRTIEAYSGTLDSSGQENSPDQENSPARLAKHVNFLRIGRIAFYYQNLHGQGGGLWLPSEGKWQSLDSEQNMVVRKAIQIAQQQRVPELLPLPVPKSTND